MKENNRLRTSSNLKRLDILNKTLRCSGISLMVVGALTAITAKESNSFPASIEMVFGIFSMVPGIVLFLNSLSLEERMIINSNKIATWPGHQEGCSNKLNPINPLIVESKISPSLDKMGFLIETKSITCNDCRGSVLTRHEFKEPEHWMP